MQHAHRGNVMLGKVRWSPIKSLWWTGMVCISLIGGWATFSWTALALFLLATAAVLLFGHSLGSHRKLIHDSFGCPKWLEYALVYAGVQVGLAGPLGLLAQHNLRDYAQRQPDCHDFLRHGRSFERTWMLQQIPPALALYALGGWDFVIRGVCARIAAAVTGHWLIGYFAHNHGSMHQTVDGAAVQGHNVKFASLLTMGESWHNNHHDRTARIDDCYPDVHPGGERATAGATQERCAAGAVHRVVRTIVAAAGRGTRACRSHAGAGAVGPARR
jgi:stearoyl-CoA desaturase (delta-9 desaturase)